MLEILKTDGVWKCAPTGGLVRVWSDLPNYIYKENDVPFWFGPHFNLGMDYGLRQAFIARFKIKKIQEIIEVFREPFNDIDPSFRGRGLLMASFDDEADAIVFRLAMPSANPNNFRLQLEDEH
jgi:hypothetical protein